VMKAREAFGKFISRGKVGGLKKKLAYADVKIKPYVFVTDLFIFLLSVALASGIGVYLYFGNVFYVIIIPIISVAVLLSTIYIVISLFEARRAKAIEDVLPDALLVMASNLRSGVPTDEAFTLSARPEFGLLAEKIRKAGKFIASGGTVQEAFKMLPKDINSKLFKQTIDLIVEGLESGGELATLLEATAYDIKDTQTIRKEIRSIIYVYALFIFIAACLIAPVLYAVSIQLASVLSKLSKTIAIQFLTEKSPTVKLAPTQITEEFLTRFAYVNLGIVTVFSSFIIALIDKGNEKYGIVYIPFLLGLAMILFHIARIALSIFFGGIRVV